MRLKLKDEYRIGTYTVPKFEKLPISIVSRAVMTDPSRPYWTAMFYSHEDHELVATDGKRLHVYHLDTAEPELRRMFPHDSDAWCEYVGGMLHVYSVSACEVKFPNYRRLYVPDEELIENGEEYVFLPGKKYQYDTCEGIEYAVARFYCDYRIPIQHSFLLDLAGEAWHVKVKKENPDRHVVLFTCGHIDALIMPFQYDKKCI